MTEKNQIKNGCGCKPIILPKNSKLLVYICKLGEQITDGGIIKLDTITENEAYKEPKGILVEAVHSTEEDAQKFNINIGDVVHFRPYAGIHKVGKDDNAYRILEGWEIHSIETN